jgi:6-phosphogluconate dehydrogenase
MELGLVGLGRMGGRMAARLTAHGHPVIAHDRAPAALAAAARDGVRGARSLHELVDAMAPPRVVWLMLPAGEATEAVVHQLGDRLERGDTIVDGGNTHHADDVRRAAALAPRGIRYLDVGTSGGVRGAAEGYCLMVGGDTAAVAACAPLFAALAAPDGWAHVGPVGAGHYVKMVHNGIEYALMQAYAEGFELMEASGYALDLARVARLWTHGSVVRSWLLELTADVLEADPRLSRVRGWVEDSGEGRWTVEDAVARAVPLPAITAALFARFRSRRDDPVADRLLAALRHAFGGHDVRR